jgi:hypothetical protein
MSVSSGNIFVFPRISMFTSTSSRETLGFSGKNNFPREQTLSAGTPERCEGKGGADIKCILSFANLKV